MKNGQHQYWLSFILVLALLGLVISGCGASQSITFSQLISQANKYNGKTVTFEAFYFSGFEISALSEYVGPSNYDATRVVPTGVLIWVQSGITQELQNKLHRQNNTPSGYPEYFGKLKVTGKFETGDNYGHMNVYQHQIAMTSAEMLEWSPSPTVTPTPANGNLRFKVIDSSYQPLGGAKVVSEEQPELQLKVSGITDTDGIVTFNDIKPGEYKFYASRFDYQQKNGIPAVVIPSQISSVTVMLDAAE
jgi:hypothetical protein